MSLTKELGKCLTVAPLALADMRYVADFPPGTDDTAAQQAYRRLLEKNPGDFFQLQHRLEIQYLQNEREAMQAVIEDKKRKKEQKEAQPDQPDKGAQEAREMIERLLKECDA